MQLPSLGDGASDRRVRVRAEGFRVAGEAERRGGDGGGGPHTSEGHCELISTLGRRRRADHEEGGEVRKRGEDDGR